MTSSAPLGLIAASLLIDAFVFGLVMFWPRRHREGEPAAGPPYDLSRLLLALIAGGVVFAFKLPFLRQLGLRPFGMMTLGFMELFFVVPLFGAVLLAIHLRFSKPNPGPRVSKSVAILAAMTLLLVPICAYATFIEPFRLQLETADVQLPAERAGREPITIGVLADIQTDCVGEHEREAVARVMAEEPDIILLPGDLFQGNAAQLEEQLPALRELLASLDAPGGVYFVNGDCELRRRSHLALQGTPVRVLVNQAVRGRVRDREVLIGGIERDCDTDAARALIRRMEEPGGDDTRILMSHDPYASLRQQPESRIDLLVSGHTHGGQVVVPFFGPPITFTTIPRNMAAGGLHELRGNKLYVSRGVGCERGQAPRIRFLCPPEISLLTLKD